MGTFAVNGLARFFIQPDEQTLLSSGLEIGTRPNGRSLLYFTRNLANGGRVAIDPESTVTINYAYGTGPDINYHGPRARGSVRVPINRVVVKPMAVALNELGVEAPVEAKTAVSEEPIEPLDAETSLDAEMDAEMDAMLEASGVDAGEMDDAVAEEAVAEEAMAEEAAAVAESEPEAQPEAQPEVQISWEEEPAPGIPLVEDALAELDTAEDALAELDAAVKIEETINDQAVKDEAMNILSTIDEMSSQNSCPDTMARLEKLENDFDMLKRSNIRSRQEGRERVATQQEVNSRIVHEIAGKSTVPQTIYTKLENNH